MTPATPLPMSEESARAGTYAGLRPSLLSLLRCPRCLHGTPAAPHSSRADSGHLEIHEVVEGTAEAVRAGSLRCPSCATIYPIELGVPRMLPLEDLSDLQRATRESFGFQWQSFARRIEQWKDKCREYFAPFEPREIGRVSVLDAGCGYGRWLAEVAKGGGMCVGLDLSDAVFTAAEYLADQPDCHFVQGDILRPPFAAARFHTVYSIGVLHHLPDGAPAGVHALAPLVEPDGLFFVWLYGRHRGDQTRSLYALTRRLTRRLPRRLMTRLCALAAVAVNLGVLVPKRLLSRFRATRALADRLPFHSYRDLPLSELRTDLFDMYATPIEYGYDGEQTRRMLEQEGDLRDVQVSAYGIPRNPEASWRGWGRRRPEGKA